MQLAELLRACAPIAAQGVETLDIQSITADSRQAQTGSLFVAVRGHQSDGHRYIAQAIERGAAAIVCEQLPDFQVHIPLIQVRDSAQALGLLAARFYGDPSQDLTIVGVTGTNGKTTTATLLYRLFMRLGYPVGLISTVEYRIGNQVFPSTHTTPDSVRLQQLFAQMRDAGCAYVFMEVSSHAAHQQRIAGTRFAGAVFTNITHDHLDYHGTFQNYIAAKKLFFDGLPKTAFALTNLDDKRGEIMLQNTAAKRLGYALKSPADYKAKIVENALTGLLLEIDGREVHTRLVGEFNAYNLLAVYAVAVQLEVEPAEALRVLSDLQAVEGRFDYVASAQRQLVGIVDYAHTPDALEKVLKTLDQLRQGNARILTVVGCGGDRDRTKRPIMAKTACAYSQQVILTSDNPRTESPEAILAEMETGVPADAKRKTLVISDRRQAIRTACALAQPGDIILVAGKGHEKYQEINGVRHPFDDKSELEAALS